MQARIKNPAMLFPDAIQALLALKASAEKGGVTPAMLQIVHLRASQINGCSVCVDLGWRELKNLDESDERIFGVSAWRDTPYFTDAERAALALTEAVTRLSDRSDPVPDEIWNEAARHYDERQLGSILLTISMTNVWNRLNVATRQIAGEWVRSAAREAQAAMRA